MRTLKSLIEKNKKVWFYCGTEDLQKRFLKQAEEDFICHTPKMQPVEITIRRE